VEAIIEAPKHFQNVSRRVIITFAITEQKAGTPL